MSFWNGKRRLIRGFQYLSINIIIATGNCIVIQINRQLSEKYKSELIKGF